MSRVSFPGFRNGFPFVLPPFSTVPAVPALYAPEDVEGNLNVTSFPLSVPLHVASRWYWRVRQWKVAWTASSGGTPWGGTSIFGWEKPTSGDARPCNEANLVSMPVGWAATRENDWYGTYAMAYPMNFKIVTPGTIEWRRSPNPPRGAKDGANVRLGLVFECQASVGAIVLSSHQTNTNHALQPRTGTGSVVCNLVDQGTTYEIPLYNNVGNYLYFTDYGAATFTITPHRFWPYHGLYDETTGEPVVAPILTSIA